MGSGLSHAPRLGQVALSLRSAASLQVPFEMGFVTAGGAWCRRPGECPVSRDLCSTVSALPFSHRDTSSTFALQQICSGFMLEEGAGALENH